MPILKRMIARTNKFYSTAKEQFSRYQSWEHCYEMFQDARNSKTPNYDYLALHLGFYLASWGMYRGSTLLLQRDYKIHIGAVKEILNSKYDSLNAIKCSDYLESNGPKNLQLLKNLSDCLHTIYGKFRKPTDPRITDTLITKVLLGTLGCVPAYDRNVKAGLKREGFKHRSYSTKSVYELADFYDKNKAVFLSSLSIMETDSMKLRYPEMKIMDMCLW